MGNRPTVPKDVDLSPLRNVGFTPSELERLFVAFWEFGPEKDGRIIQNKILHRRPGLNSEEGAHFLEILFESVGTENSMSFPEFVFAASIFQYPPHKRDKEENEATRRRYREMKLRFLYHLFDLERNALITRFEFKVLLRNMSVDFRDHDTFIRECMKDRLETGVDYERFREVLLKNNEDESFDIISFMSADLFPL